MTSKLDDPKMQERFIGFEKTLQFFFTDTNNYALKFTKDKCEIIEGEVEDADMKITTTSQVIIETNLTQASFHAGFLVKSSQTIFKLSFRCRFHQR